MFARLRTVLTLLACFSVFALPGCGGGGGGGTTGNDPTVYFVNASPDAGPLDFLMNAIVRALNLDYLGSSTGFTTVPFISDANGGYDVVTRENGTNVELDAQNVVLNKNTHTAFACVGLKNYAVGEELKRLRTFGINIDRDSPNGNKARLYIVHGFIRELGQDTPDIIFQNAGDNPQFFTQAIAFGNSAALLVDSGTADWWAKRSDATADVVYAAATLTLDPGAVYLVIVSGIENDPAPALQPAITLIELPTT
jgi:hypothetical protein